MRLRKTSQGAFQPAIIQLMTVVAAQPPSHFTPDDLLNLDDGHLYELVGGKLVEKQMSSLASETAGIIIVRLGNFILESRAGKLYPEQTFKCFAHDPDLIRRPDIALITADRVASVPEEGHVPIAPDLAIEVVSPNDKIYELDEKLADYRSAAVKLVWVVNPKARTLRIRRLDHTVTELEETDTLSGESVLPGFSILVRDLLPTPSKT